MNETKVNTKIGDVASPETKKVTMSRDWLSRSPLALVHTDMGLNNGAAPWTFIKDAAGHEHMLEGAEPVLRIVELFNVRDRASLLASAAEHYELPFDAFMGRQIPSTATSGGAQ